MVLGVLLCAASAHAESKQLRIATIAPEGSGWANELKLYAHNVEQHTSGRVHIKWFMNGVTGDEPEMAERIKRGQLDGAVSGGLFCQQVAPSLRVLRVPALFQNIAEANQIIDGLHTLFVSEARERGFTYLAGAPVGTDVLFTKKPIRTMAEMRALRIWRWRTDDVAIALDRLIGLNVQPSDLHDVNKTLEHDGVDGLWAIPTAAVVWEWTLRAPVVLNLHSSYLFGCVVVSNQALLGVLPEDVKELTAATAVLRDRMEAVTLRTEKVLLGGALQHQGVKVIEPGEGLRDEFFAAANTARDRENAGLVSKELLTRVLRILADYRAAHGR
jgi:TRAP-type C4-dicarboxylate transport system substrate-binding protein